MTDQNPEVRDSTEVEDSTPIVEETAVDIADDVQPAPAAAEPAVPEIEAVPEAVEPEPELELETAQRDPDASELPEGSEPPEGSELDADPDDGTDVVDAEVVGLDLGDEAPPPPTGTDFEVAESPHLTEAGSTGDLDIAAPATPPMEPSPAAAPPTDPAASAAPVPTPLPPTPPVAGGSFLDLPPLPDLDYPAPTPPPASPYPPPAPSYPQAANYPRSAGYPQADYAPYPVDYSEQAAGQAYGHGTATPQHQPAPVAPANPYGTPTGFAVQPYQQGVPVGDVTMASAAHWGALVATVASGGSLGFLVPLIIMLTRGQNDPFVRANATESLNFSLTVLIGMVASALLVLIFVGIVGLVVIPIVALILQILGALAANRGEVYRYPVSIRFVK